MRFRLPSRASDRPDRRPSWRRPGSQAGHCVTALVLGVLLAVLGACADTPTAPRAVPDAPQRLLVAAPGYTKVSGGLFYTCALTNAGAITCWGNNSEGQASPPSGTGYTQVSSARSGDHSCSLTGTGAIACWGYNGDGQASPPSGTGYTQVSAGGFHSCAVTSAGAITCWGDNGYGQASPPSGTGYTQVSAGVRHGCALTSAGAITCWGYNGDGQASPPSGTGYTQVSAGRFHSCALTSTGAITCWGGNGGGQASPPSGTGYTQLGAGSFHSCALTSAGAIACWGSNGYGQVSPPSGTGYTQLGVGGFHGCALIGAGSVACWGHNGYGQTTPPTLPPPIHVLPTAVFAAPASVVAGQPFTLALTSAQVPGHPEATAFTYAFDCGTGQGYAPAASTATTSCPTTAAGTRAVRGKVIDQDGDTASYAATIQVTRAAQAITFTSTPPTPALVGGTYTVRASGGASGAPVTFSSLTSAVCTVGGSTVTFVAQGACTIAADQAGNAIYDPAPQVRQAFTVSVPAPVFPRTAVLDRFARANGALGSAWGGFVAPLFFQVQGQQGVVALGGGIGWAADAFGTTQEAFVTLSALGSNGGSGAQGLVLKGQDPREHTLGALTVTVDPKAGVVGVSVLRIKPTAATSYPVLAVRFAAGDQLGARATAAGAVEVYRNGTLVGTVTLNAADKAYFATRGGYVGLLYVAAPGARFDDFGGGSVAP